jgi:two-component system, OmpR family, alkaline phosphatase synthesis response regulator PhoP
MNSKKKIVIIDSDIEVLELLKLLLEEQGFNVITLSDTKNVFEKINNSISLLITEIHFKNLDGFELIRRIRRNPKYFTLPIIVLTKSHDEELEIKALNSGANDFLRKPVSLKILLTRINSKLKKPFTETSISNISKDRIVAGNIVIDSSSHTIFVSGEKIYFPKKEFALLFLLLSHPGSVFRRDRILTEVWGTDISVVDRTIDVHIRRIRKRLGAYSTIIKTIKGVGYKYEVEA